ncbi:fibronectin type III domain-containing protein [Bacillus shihchuchen]|uniref:Fibronectin type III domain-containing protein n=1 Tax=Bacillus shihchuchen TaxID=3036942 RepID=A0ABT7KW29_9BACI|nr:fibronectin type III domain-containing protein [Bacillus shihchuchen]
MILAVWDVADTANAFYNVIDVNLINDVKPDTEAPSIPNGIQAQKVTAHSIELAWTASTDNVGVKGYQIFRNGEMIDTVPGTHYIDKKLQPSTEYSYTVKAIDAAGNASKESAKLTVKTAVEAPDTEAPTQPKDYIVWERQRQVWI